MEETADNEASAVKLVKSAVNVDVNENKENLISVNQNCYPVRTFLLDHK